MVESRPFSGNVTSVSLNVISARPMQNLVQFLLRDDGKSPCSMMLHVWMSFYRLPFKHLLSKNDPVIMVHTQTDIYIYVYPYGSKYLLRRCLGYDLGGDLYLLRKCLDP